MTTEVTKQRSYVVGDRPAHEHRCPEGHTWPCNSPYCESSVSHCPSHGGPEPIVQGREPWRGR